MKKLVPVSVFAIATGLYWLAMWWLFVASTTMCRVTGACTESGHVYGSLSGFGGTLLFAGVMLAPPWYVTHTCHYSWTCMRPGTHLAAGGTFRLCGPHHPDIQGKPLTAELIARLHREHKQR